MFLLDTNVVSELRKAGRADANVGAWAARQDAGTFFISSITMMELEKGVQLAEHRDAGQGALLRGWLDGRVKTEFAQRVLALDAAAAVICAGLHVPRSRPLADSMIAATALRHGLMLVTRNIADFAGMGLRLVNPWLEKPNVS